MADQSTVTVLVSEPDLVYPHAVACGSCDRRIPRGVPFLRVMALAGHEIAQAGEILDECEKCAERYGRGRHFSDFYRRYADATEEGDDE